MRLFSKVPCITRTNILSTFSRSTVQTLHVTLGASSLCDVRENHPAFRSMVQQDRWRDDSALFNTWLQPQFLRLRLIASLCYPAVCLCAIRVDHSRFRVMTPGACFRLDLRHPSTTVALDISWFALSIFRDQGPQLVDTLHWHRMSFPRVILLLSSSFWTFG